MVLCLKWWWCLTLSGKTSNYCHLLTGFMVVVCLLFWICLSHTQHFVTSALQAHIFHLLISHLPILVSMTWNGVVPQGQVWVTEGRGRLGKAGLLSSAVTPGVCLAGFPPRHQLCTSSSYKSIALRIKILDHVESCKTVMRVSDPNDRLGNLLALIPHLIL